MNMTKLIQMLLTLYKTHGELHSTEVIKNTNNEQELEVSVEKTKIY
ncbi:hypothetical protein BsIDN1_09700 [Bacillus safensis]|uniref:Uncharacterized protein n=1 Tax=Bacillus safensis TaxID=561879 RepID=A0A5S9M3M9_BACIA|nr:hypothetical protein BsIDN1_09700 [Bacillus safensis]